MTQAPLSRLEAEGTRPHRPWAAWCAFGAVLVAAGGAGLLVLVATARGPGLGPDSLKYILLARSLAEGRGFTLAGEPVTHFPPAYPVLLRLAGIVGPETLGFARYLQAAFFAINVLLAAWVARTASSRAPEVNSGAPPCSRSLGAALPAAWLSRSPRVACAAWAALAALGVANLSRSVSEAGRLGSGGGFSHPYWQRSPTLDFARRLDPGVRLYSNGPEIVAFFTGRQVGDVPAQASRTSLQPDPGYAQRLDAFCAGLATPGTALVQLEGVGWRWELPTSEEIESTCRLTPLARFDDGAVYGRPRTWSARAPRGAEQVGVRLAPAVSAGRPPPAS